MHGKCDQLGVFCKFFLSQYLTNTSACKRIQTEKTAKNLRFHLQFTTQLDCQASLTHIIVDAMREDANTHTSIMLLTHPAFITLSVSFGLVIYTQDLVIM